jgi:penicillin-binding protein 2
MRLNVLRNGIFLFFGLIIMALFYMQIIRGEHYHAQSVNNRIRLVPSDAPRGRIFDRNGIVLADNRPSYNIAVIPQDVEDATSLFAFLGRVLDKDARSVQKTFTRRRLTPFDPVIVAEDVDRKALITVEENRFQYSGLVVQESFERFYPLQETTAHAVGYVGRIDPSQAEILQAYGYAPLTLVGKTGVEQFYETQLQGEPGGRQIEVNSRGREVRLLSTKEPLKGKDIVLTIDGRVQAMATRLLGGARGSVIVMDLSGGDLLAAVSSPTFDPNAFTRRDGQEKVVSYIRNPHGPLFNRAVAGQFPPGSVFKIPVALAALERDRVTASSTFECPGYYTIGSSRFGCTHVHRGQDVYQAMAHSCNVYFYHAGLLTGPSAVGAYAKALGLGHPTRVDLPFETSGRLVTSALKGRPWYPGDTLNLSIGQGETLSTPLQLTVMLASVAHRGIMLRPRILKELAGRNIAATELGKRPRVRLHDESWAIVQRGLQMVVESPEGTAHLLADLKDMKIWGKTGTAQAGKQGDHAWFVGYLRSEKSNLAFCVFLEHGGSSSNAVAITHALLSEMKGIGII